MSLTSVFPRALAACLLTGLFAAQGFAQTSEETRPRQVTTTTTANGAPRLENEPMVISLAEEADAGAATTTAPAPLTMPSAARAGQFEHTLLAAIEGRLGVPYRLGATGPSRYDCSGFVWSVFQSAGMSFERGTARHLWDRFAPANEGEKYRLGTLVFFNNLGHVGIVADARGFYHASSSKGVVYSPFNDYWNARIVGFRRIDLPRGELFASAVE